MQNNTTILNSLIRLSVEYWRIHRSYGRTIDTVPSEHQTRLRSTCRHAHMQLHEILAQAGITIYAPEGEPYAPNMAVSVMNADECELTDGIVITQVLEPIVMQGTQVLQNGKVFIGKPEN